MVRLDAASRIVGVDMECVQMCTDLLHRLELLDHRSAGLEDTALGRARIADDAAGIVARGAFSTGGHFILVYWFSASLPGYQSGLREYENGRKYSLLSRNIRYRGPGQDLCSGGFVVLASRFGWIDVRMIVFLGLYRRR